MITNEQFELAIENINAIHNEDPTWVEFNGKLVKAEYLYIERMLEILKLVAPNSSLELQLAAKCQHMSRWSIARSTFEKNKKGYYQWRAAIMEHQLSITTKVLLDISISNGSVSQIVDALKNKADKLNLNASIIEDTACLVFIKWYLVPFAQQFELDKAKSILIKTAAKMSEHGLSLIKRMELSAEVLQVLALLDEN